MKPIIREKLERCSTLPTLPSVAIRILELCQQEALDLNQITSVISNDPALAAKLIKTANSPIFALRKEVTTISYAVSLLGVSAVRTLVLSFSLSKECQTGNHSSLKNFWRRSVLSAIAARQLCRDEHVGLREEAFLCGLLQDIGMLALSRALGSQYNKLLTMAGRDHDALCDLERSAFGVSHAEVGSWLLGRWRVPHLLADVVGASHDPSKIEPSNDDVGHLACIVAASARFADLWAGDPAKAPASLGEELARWPAGAVDVEGVNAHLIEQAPQLAPLFDIVLDVTEMSTVLEQAQDALVAISMQASRELTDIHAALARLESRTATLLAEAQRDALTGVANRGYTSSYLDDVFRAAVESSRPIGVIFADVDHFKSVNDTHGHAAGDAVLQSVAQCITRSLRGGDFVGRWGGEEFVIILRADQPSEVAMIAERIRTNIAAAPHSIGAGRSLPVTVSLGCALLEPRRHRTPADLLAEADRALYAAKRGGRNRSERADEALQLSY
ncbi:MAG: HDOD domain-containing protein [Bryobacteraceae bacterium]